MKITTQKKVKDFEMRLFNEDEVALIPLHASCEMKRRQINYKRHPFNLCALHINNGSGSSKTRMNGNAKTTTKYFKYQNKILRSIYMSPWAKFAESLFVLKNLENPKQLIKIEPNFF